MKNLAFLTALAASAACNVYATEEGHPVKPAKEHKVKHTLLGELCTAKADERNLISHEWRKFMAECIKENQPPRPQRAEVASCFKESDALVGAEKKASLKTCLNKVKYEKD